MALDTVYDAVNAAIFLPSGGSRRVRRALVDALGVRPGHRVIELGCGTGQVTELLVDAGADVVAVDALPAMLVGARRRAPGATIVEGDAFDPGFGGGYDRVVLSFVLHNFDHDGRVRLLRRAADAVDHDGLVGILEWAVPPGRTSARLWRRFLALLEPSESVPEILDGSLEHELSAAGLEIAARRTVAGGRAAVMVSRRLR